MRNVLILFIMAFSFNACNNVSTINKDPKARYILAAETMASVMRTLTHLRKTKMIKNDNDWLNIKALVKTTMTAFNNWGDAIQAGKTVPDLEKLAMDGLNTLSELQKIYEQ